MAAMFELFDVVALALLKVHMDMARLAELLAKDNCIGRLRNSIFRHSKLVSMIHEFIPACVVGSTRTDKSNLEIIIPPVNQVTSWRILRVVCIAWRAGRNAGCRDGIGGTPQQADVRIIA